MTKFTIRECARKVSCFAFAGLFALTLLSPTDASAKPAAKGVINMELPDGTTLPVRMIGDEFSHRVLTEDGYLLAADSEGFYCYAELDASGNIVATSRRATAANRRSASDAAFLSSLNKENMLSIAENIDSERRAAKLNSRAKAPMSRANTSVDIDFLFSNYPSTGSPKALVILVEYKDISFRMSGDPYEYFNGLLHQEGFSTNGATGSCLDWFKENSKGQFTPEFDLYGPIKLSQNRSYYGGNDMYGQDMRPEEMIIEACKQLDATVDFSIYDTDGDGYIDNVYVFYAGGGEADGGGSSTVWPHSWNIEGGARKTVILDGVKLDRYACSAEWDTMSKRPDGIGTFVHEFSHVMGLPDLYATNYSNSWTPGEWSVMDYGPYNNDGRTPPNYSSFERFSLGWLEPRRFSGKKEMQPYTIMPITENDAFLVETNNNTDFYMLEFRQRTGNDFYLPNSGMLVWRIRYNANAWNGNSVNNNSSLQRVDVIEADNIRSEASMAGDVFPGTKNVTSFTSATVPSLTNALGQTLHVDIYNIGINVGGFLNMDVTHDLPETGVTEIAASDNTFAIRVSGNVINVESAGEVRIINLSGTTVASVNGNGSLELPAGVYIATDGRSASKVIIR